MLRLSVSDARLGLSASLSRLGEFASTTASYGLDIVYPRRCGGCGGELADRGMHLCWECLAGAVYVKDPFCSCCGDPVDGAVHHAFLCSWCRRTRPAFALARSAIRFRGVMKQVVHAFKYERACHLAGDLGGLLAGCVRAHYAGIDFDGVAYVPLHPLKARERSFNQSRLLAVSSARQLEIPVLHRSLARVRMTCTQTRLSAEERKSNVRGAFRAAMPEWIDGRRLLLVDDVMTTGATVNECAKVLVQAGARSVHVVTVARG
jgi:ComF family protein